MQLKIKSMIIKFEYKLYVLKFSDIEIKLKDINISISILLILQTV